jgi:hypothetical protein
MRIGFAWLAAGLLAVAAAGCGSDGKEVVPKAQGPVDPKLNKIDGDAAGGAKQKAVKAPDQYGTN